MRFELGHVPMPEGYGEGILPIDACKAHLRVTHDSENELIQALRDAAIEFVERYCGVRLGPVTGLTWRAESLPRCTSDSISLAVRPVTAITSIAWQDGDGTDVIGDVADYRVGASGELRPVIGGSWPSGVGGEVVVTFDAGFAEGEAPPSLLQAVRLMLGHLYMNREAATAGGAVGEVPLGVTSLCMPFRRVMI